MKIVICPKNHYITFLVVRNSCTFRKLYPVGRKSTLGYVGRWEKGGGKVLMSETAPFSQIPWIVPRPTPNSWPPRRSSQVSVFSRYGWEIFLSSIQSSFPSSRFPVFILNLTMWSNLKMDPGILSSPLKVQIVHACNNHAIGP